MTIKTIRKINFDNSKETIRFKTQVIESTVKKINPITRFIKGYDLFKAIYWLKISKRRGLDKVAKDLENCVKVKEKEIGAIDTTNLYISSINIMKSYIFRYALRRGSRSRASRNKIIYVRLGFELRFGEIKKNN